MNKYQQNCVVTKLIFFWWNLAQYLIDTSSFGNCQSHLWTADEMLIFCKYDKHHCKVRHSKEENVKQAFAKPNIKAFLKIHKVEQYFYLLFSLYSSHDIQNSNWSLNNLGSRLFGKRWETLGPQGRSIKPFPAQFCLSVLKLECWRLPKELTF